MKRKVRVCVFVCVCSSVRVHELAPHLYLVCPFVWH